MYMCTSLIAQDLVSLAATNAPQHDVSDLGARPRRRPDPSPWNGDFPIDVPPVLRPVRILDILPQMVETARVRGGEQLQDNLDRRRAGVAEAALPMVGRQRVRGDMAWPQERSHRPESPRIAHTPSGGARSTALRRWLPPQGSLRPLRVAQAGVQGSSRAPGLDSRRRIQPAGSTCIDVLYSLYSYSNQAIRDHAFGGS
jgi:hypothetical protein